MLTKEQVLNSSFVFDYQEWFLMYDGIEWDVEVLKKDSPDQVKELILTIFSLLPADAEDETELTVKEVLERAEINVRKLKNFLQ